MKQLSSLVLRLALFVLLLATVLAQVLVPVYASGTGTRHPEVGYLVIPYSLAAILFIGCGQVALLAVWRLLSLVDGEIIFTHRAVRWVDVIVTCGAAATALAAVVLVHMFAFVPGGGGPMGLYLVACTVASLAFVLLMLVMRGLLLTAIADRAELDEVI